MGMERAVATGVTCAVVAACGGVITGVDPSGPCLAPGLDTSSWDVVDRAGFDFRLPPGFVDLQLQPIDSDAQAYELGDGEAFLTYDFGFYTADLTDFVCSVDIGGHPARVSLREEAGTTYVTARWRSVGQSQSGGPDTALLMRGETGRADAVDAMLAAIHTVEIH